MGIVNIENTIRDWVVGQAGANVEVIFTTSSAPRPKTSNYVTINMFSIQDTGEPFGTYDRNMDDTIALILNAPREFTVSVNVYYPGAFQMAIDLQASFNFPNVIEALQTGGLGYLNSTTVQKIPEVLYGKWEERAQFDITFLTGLINLQTVTTPDIPAIDKIKITNELDNTIEIIEE